MPHVFFKIQGGDKESPKGFYLPLFTPPSLVSDDGKINTTGIIDRYNADPRINGTSLIISKIGRAHV